MDAENSALLSEINDILNCNISQYKQDAMPIILYHIREKDAGQEIDLFLFEHHWVHQRETVEDCWDSQTVRIKSTVYSTLFWPKTVHSDVKVCLTVTPITLQLFLWDVLWWPTCIKK